MDQVDATVEEGRGLPPAVIITIMLLLVAAVAVVMLSQKRKFEPVHAGTDAIDFTLPDLDGKPVSMSDFRGKVVFLNFWATWCKPCEDEMPSMQMLYESLKGQPFEIVAVSVDSEGPEVVRKFAEDYGLTFTILHDRKGRIKDTYKTTGVPETFIIDQKGVIAEKVWGPRDWTDPRNLQIIKDLLKSGPRPREAYRAKRPS